MIPGDLLSAFPHRQFHTLPGLLDSWAVLPNSNPNACMPMQGGSLYHFYDGLWYDPAERRTHDLPCERGTSYRLSQPDTSFNPKQHARHLIKNLTPKKRILYLNNLWISFLSAISIIIRVICVMTDVLPTPGWPTITRGVSLMWRQT